MLAKVLRDMDILAMPGAELTPAALEVLARYHLGLIPPREGARLAAIFQRNPADAADRLERAAEHLGITGAQAGELLDLAAQRGPHPARDYRPSTPADRSTARLAGVPADRLGAPSSAIDKASYQTHAPSEGCEP